MWLSFSLVAGTSLRWRVREVLNDLRNLERKLGVESSSGDIVTDKSNPYETRSTKPAVLEGSSSNANWFSGAPRKHSLNMCLLIIAFGAKHEYLNA